MTFIYLSLYLISEDIGGSDDELVDMSAPGGEEDTYSGIDIGHVSLDEPEEGGETRPIDEGEEQIRKGFIYCYYYIMKRENRRHWARVAGRTGRGPLGRRKLN